MTENRSKPNRLIHEKSPYLIQHAYNPVDWYPWGPEGLEKARQNIVPLSKTMKEEINALQQWAVTRARKANSPDKPEIKPARRIQSHVAHQPN